MQEDLQGLPLPLTGESRLYAIVGDPIAQVGSPGLFNPAFRRRGATAVLTPMHVAPQDLPLIVAAMRATRNFDGLVITVPHKIAVMGLVDEVREGGRRVGAVNAVRKTADGRLVADNFDGEGCVRGVKGAGKTLAGKSALIVGAGGAGRAVAHAVADEGPSRLRLFDVDAARSGELLASLGAAHPALSIDAGAADPTGFDVVVNCTPLGMSGGDPFPVDPARLAPDAMVIDVILKPAVSPLLAAARARGCWTQTGLRMLEGQVDAVCDFFEIGSSR